MRLFGTIAVWFSCGAATAEAALKTIEHYRHLADEILIVNNPVMEEDVDNRRFLADVESWLNVKIHIALNSKYPEASADKVWKDRRYMSGIDGAPCTVQLKKEARRQFETTHKIDYHVLGFTSEESGRAERFQKFERSNLIPVLVDLGITKKQCFEIINQAGIRLPRVYEQGYPNANCIGCVKATSPTYWNHVRANHPEVFTERAKLSKELGVRLTRVKGKRIFLDELDPAYKGRKMKGMNIECGIFCETKL